MATRKSVTSLEALNAQIAELQAQADALRKREVADIVEKIKSAINHYGLTAADLGLGTSARKTGPKNKSAATGKAAGTTKTSKKPSAAPKYRDDQGNEWVGRGKRPVWFTAALAAGKTPEDLLAKP